LFGVKFTCEDGDYGSVSYTFMPGFRPEDTKQNTTEIKETLVRLHPWNVPLSDSNKNLLARAHYTVVRGMGRGLVLHAHAKHEG